MEYLGIPESRLESAGGYWTAREIAQQPTVWLDIERRMQADAEKLHAYLAPLLSRRDLKIVLTGAGSSAYVGECLAPALIQANHRATAVSTTDIVSAPDRWLERVPTLLVSFARSGNSPESVAALRLADQHLTDCHHLVITCNRDGALYQRVEGRANGYAILLPEVTNDRSFAMTSSYSGMLLAGAIGFDLLRGTRAASLADPAAEMLEIANVLAAHLAGRGFERVVFLGSNECKGLAQEAALKMLELSDGRIVTLAQTPLGFRHGPKTILNAKTLVVAFLCNDPYTRRYELDVCEELRREGVAGRIVVLDAARAQGPTRTHDDAGGPVVRLTGASRIPDVALSVVYVLFAQILAFHHSLMLGLRPDLPNTQGVVSRVVQGFSIHPWAAR